MASCEENIDFMKLLYWKQSSVANPVRVGGGYQVWTHLPNFLGFTIYLHSNYPSPLPQPHNTRDLKGLRVDSPYYNLFQTAIDI